MMLIFKLVSNEEDKYFTQVEHAQVKIAGGDGFGQ